MADGASGRGELSDHDLAGLIADEIRKAVTFDASELADKRSRAIEYLRGEMADTPARPHGSQVTSRDLADTISWMLPGIMRVFMASERMADYEPVAPDNPDPMSMQKAEQYAEQASDYMSYVLMKDNDGYRLVYNATFDSLLTGNGIVKHWWDDTPQTRITHHTRLTEEQVAALQVEEGVKILAAEKNAETDMVMDPMTGQPMPVETWNVKVERVTSRGRLRVDCIEPENFIKDDMAVTIDDCRFCAHRDPYMTRSRLVEMGFDKDVVDNLSAQAQGTFNDTIEGLSRRGSRNFMGGSLVRSMELVDYYECYLKVDVDGDGIAETCKIHYAGAGSTGDILDWEIWEDDVPFSDIPCYPQPHKFEAESVADRTVDIQQIKTVLERGMLDNVYASGLPMREVEEGSVTNPDILISPKFGGLIWKKRGSQPIIPHEIPFVADKMLAATAYLDEVLERRTGVSRMSMALDPDTLQNQSATANQNAHDASYSQIELVARNMAELGWTRVFRKLLRLIVEHQDRPRMILLRGKFVEMDPRAWNADMNCTVNTGLGSGSRDRDMAMLNNTLMSQLAITDRFAGAGFNEEAIDMMPRIRQTLVKLAESAGIRNPQAFYPEIDDQKLQMMKQQAQQKAKEPPLEIKLAQLNAQTQMQLKQADVQGQQQLKGMDLQHAAGVEQIKAQGNQIKEAAQLEGDLKSKAADRENQLILGQQQGQLEREKIAADMETEREKIASQERIALLQSQDKQFATMTTAATHAAGQDAKAQGGGKKPAGGKQAEPLMHPMMKMMDQMSQAMTALAAAHSQPKRVNLIKDANGRTVGGTVQ